MEYNHLCTSQPRHWVGIAPTVPLRLTPLLTIHCDRLTKKHDNIPFLSLFSKLHKMLLIKVHVHYNKIRHWSQNANYLYKPVLPKLFQSKVPLLKVIQSFIFLPVYFKASNAPCIQPQYCRLFLHYLSFRNSYKPMSWVINSSFSKVWQKAFRFYHPAAAPLEQVHSTTECCDTYIAKLGNTVLNNIHLVTSHSLYFLCHSFCELRVISWHSKTKVEMTFIKNKWHLYLRRNVTHWKLLLMLPLNNVTAAGSLSFNLCCSRFSVLFTAWTAKGNFGKILQLHACLWSLALQMLRNGICPKLN